MEVLSSDLSLLCSGPASSASSHLTLTAHDPGGARRPNPPGFGGDPSCAAAASARASACSCARNSAWAFSLSRLM